MLREVTIIEVNTSEPETDENKINSSACSQAALESGVFLLIYLIFSWYCKKLLYPILFILYLVCVFGDSYVSVTQIHRWFWSYFLGKIVDTVFWWLRDAVW